MSKSSLTDRRGTFRVPISLFRMHDLFISAYLRDIAPHVAIVHAQVVESGMYPTEREVLALSPLFAPVPKNEAAPRYRLCERKFQHWCAVKEVFYWLEAGEGTTSEVVNVPDCPFAVGDRVREPRGRVGTVVDTYLATCDPTGDARDKTLEWRVRCDRPMVDCDHYDPEEFPDGLYEQWAEALTKEGNGNE